MTIPLSIINLDPDSHFYNDVRICNDECEYLNEQTFREKGEVMGITSAGSRLRGARGILLSAGPLRRGLATFATSTGAREPVRGKYKLSSQGLKEDGNFNRLIFYFMY